MVISPLCTPETCSWVPAAAACTVSAYGFFLAVGTSGIAGFIAGAWLAFKFDRTRWVRRP